MSVKYEVLKKMVVTAGLKKRWLSATTEELLEKLDKKDVAIPAQYMKTAVEIMRLLPGMILFFIFWLVHQIARIAAFSKGLTPYPKGCWIFCLAVGVALTMLLKLFPETPVRC